eukprot:scaffold3350_cov268-Pinguiococcus_pyrenoidosus.AAC.16
MTGDHKGNSVICNLSRLVSVADPERRSAGAPIARWSTARWRRRVSAPGEAQGVSWQSFRAAAPWLRMAEEESFWWRRGIFQKPRAVVRWDHTEEGRMSRSVAEEGRKVTWSELFFDLVFVTLISRLGEAFQEGHMTLLQAVLVFRVLIENWWDVTMYTCRFFTDDVPSKLINGAHMFLLIMAGMKLQEPFEDSVPTFLYYSGVLHLFIMLPYIRVVFWIKEYRAFTTATGLLPALVKGVFLISLSHADPRWFVPGMALQIVSTVLHHYVTFNCSCIKFNKASRLPIHVSCPIVWQGWRNLGSCRFPSLDPVTF